MTDTTTTTAKLTTRAIGFLVALDLLRELSKGGMAPAVVALPDADVVAYLHGLVADEVAASLVAQAPEVDPQDPYRSHDVPMHYDTVLHYMTARGVYPEDLGLKAGFQVKARGRRERVEPVKVPAPLALTDLDMSIQTVNAWPVWLLDEVIGRPLGLDLFPAR